jgi:hypothetical protein
MLVPATQLVPSQQPPLQVAPPAQLPLHWCVVVLHAVPAGQSAGPLQPQVPPRQALPPLLPLQSAQISPELPHTLPLLPAAHTPPLQQAP